MKKGLNATQLKLIAILAMVCDHTAWGFVEMFSVQGQVMHTIGRLTIPIMCFFVAEGYRHTSDLRKYIWRMVVFATITVVPFYLFFGEEYGYRQNIIFDLLLALLTLTIIDSKNLNRVSKILLAGIGILISAFIGGWPILPILFVLVFYYGKDFRTKAILSGGCVLLTEASIIIIILLNNRYHFSHYDWVWYQWIYFLGFILALPLLYLYNGEKGTYPGGKLFFYQFYPGHFIILYSIRQLMNGDSYSVYILLNVLCLACAITLVVRLLFERPSKALTISTLLGSAVAIYILGFIIEIMSDNIDIAYAGVITEYFGECVVFVTAMLLAAEMCRKKVPPILLLISAIFSVVIMYMLMSTRTTHLFYTYIGMDRTGPFARLDLVYGIGFYIFICYMMILTTIIVTMGIRSLSQFTGVDRKRIILVLVSIAFPWLAYILKAVGLTGGYEISAIGVFCSLFFIYRSIMSYGYFDSIQLAGENALHHFDEGVLVIDGINNILYLNKKMQELFPDVIINNTMQNDILNKAFAGELDQFEVDGRIYDIEITPLEEHGYVQGHMLITREMTEHYIHLREAERFARTDSLTGLYNRAFFKQCFDALYEAGNTGCMLMFDLDNFKGVNDNFGHGVGDKVLLLLADTIRNVAGSNNPACRIGGDEFCLYLIGQEDITEIEEICSDMINDFATRLEKSDCDCHTSISIGASILGRDSEADSEVAFRHLYKSADNALYASKKAGKGTFRIG